MQAIIKISHFHTFDDAVRDLFSGSLDQKTD